jgi:hypothetical protein
MLLRKITFFIFFSFLLISCVEIYDIRYDFKAELVTVDGFVTDGRGLAVNLRTSISSDRNYYSQPLRDCVVELRVGDGSVVPLTEFSGGVYIAPDNFQGQAGQTYQLHFKTPQGKVYESEKEKLAGAGSIVKLYHEFNQNGILDRTGTRVAYSSLDVYADFSDPVNERNYYLWRWMDFEEQGICATCEGGKLDSKTFQCVPDRNIRTAYDYRCDKACWEIYYSNEVNIFSDVYTNGRTVTARAVSKIPFYATGAGFSNRAALVEIQQYSISSGAYEYYKLLKDQAQNTGNLTDTPPAAIIGNIKNVNDASEKVVGYFGAAGVSKSRLFIDKRPYTTAYKFLMLGRDPNLEPDQQPMPPLFEFRPPMAPCVLSANKTPVRPEGWAL